jgi:hypothetical protein
MAMAKTQPLLSFAVTHVLSLLNLPNPQPNQATVAANTSTIPEYPM